MEEINNVEVGPCAESNYLKPFRVHYSQVSVSRAGGRAGARLRANASASALNQTMLAHRLRPVRRHRDQASPPPQD